MANNTLILLGMGILGYFAITKQSSNSAPPKDFRGYSSAVQAAADIQQTKDQVQKISADATVKQFVQSKAGTSMNKDYKGIKSGVKYSNKAVAAGSKGIVTASEGFAQKMKDLGL